MVMKYSHPPLNPNPGSKETFCLCWCFGEASKESQGPQTCFGGWVVGGQVSWGWGWSPLLCLLLPRYGPEVFRSVAIRDFRPFFRVANFTSQFASEQLLRGQRWIDPDGLRAWRLQWWEWTASAAKKSKPVLPGSSPPKKNRSQTLHGFSPQKKPYQIPELARS